eukprot:jgi/Ulvmu1/12684/UM094_0041.1
MATQDPEYVAAPSRRSITFRDEDTAESVEQFMAPARRSVLRVSSMRERSSSFEGYMSRVDSPATLYATINPQYTYLKACELYGGAPRPLTARHEFCRKAFLADTEDWRSNAHIGNARSAIARMNITDPDSCTYLEEASGRKMSYYRERSLARAVSYRATMVKKNGDLADSQYTDQYFDRETVMATLRRQQSSAGGRPALAPHAGVEQALTKSLSRAPDRVLTTQLSRMSRPGSAASGAGGNALDPADRGMARAVSRIMTRARSVKISAPADALGGGHRHEDEITEECPRMEDI